MFVGRKVIAIAVVALFLATGIPLFAQQPVTAPIPATSISIEAPPGVVAGNELCFRVTCYGGIPSVVIEVNEVSLPCTITKSADDPSAYVVCCRVPGGASGSTLVITAVNSSGGVATGTVNVH
jgi:hypothetical protein